MNLSNLAAVIRQARRDLGMSQTELANKSGLSRSTISSLERDSFDDLGVRRLERICAVLNLGLSIAPLEQTQDTAVAEDHDEVETQGPRP